MKVYTKPTFEFVELRIEERLARCVYEPISEKASDGGKGIADQGPSFIVPGNHPGCRISCPS